MAVAQQECVSLSLSREKKQNNECVVYGVGPNRPIREYKNGEWEKVWNEKLFRHFRVESLGRKKANQVTDSELKFQMSCQKKQRLVKDD